ncbi:MAG: trypsin-like peptidase domain-containing protein [Chloroflexi bacterium]|nr:trypsin-like peptidase domain-containing protein [Chloroflexota bacterium]
MTQQTLPTGDVGTAAAAVAERVCASVAEVRSRGRGGGAGTVWRSDGTIVTNHHVVMDDRAEVTLADGRRFDADVVARDPRNDLAQLKIPATDLPAVAVGDARALRVGELLLAVGHPFGVRCAVTIGVVSAALPEGGPVQARELIRADVLLGPGNSGGPLTDARGRVVGINAMVAGGLALAVPSHLVERLVAGHPSRMVLGIEVREVELAPALATRAPITSGRAALVVGVSASGVAERSGLMVGDILVALDGHALEGADGLLNALATHADGPIRLGLLRGGAPWEIVAEPVEPARRAA